jgi:cell division protein FtsQ
MKGRVGSNPPPSGRASSPPRNVRLPQSARKELPSSVEAQPPPRNQESSPAPPVVRSTPPGPKGPRFARAKAFFRTAWTGTRILLGVLVVVAASLGAAWGARRYITRSPRFVIKTITVEGASKLTPDTVAQAGGVNVGANIFALDVEQVKHAIEKEPYVSEAAVVRKLPNTISIKVVERQPAVLVALGGDLYLATHSGEIFKQVEQGDDSDLPVVTGIRPEMAATDRPGVAILVRRALDVIEEAEKTAIVKRYPIEEVHIEKDGAVEAIVGREGISIYLGNPPFKGKLEQADRVLAEVQKRKINASVVFLDNDAKPDRVVVRMK